MGYQKSIDKIEQIVPQIFDDIAGEDLPIKPTIDLLIVALLSMVIEQAGEKHAKQLLALAKDFDDYANRPEIH